MAKCCPNCFYDSGLAAKIVENGTLSDCDYCKAKAKHCIDPKALQQEFEFLINSFEECQDGGSLVNIIQDCCQLFSDDVSDPQQLFTAIIGPSLLSKQFKVKYDTEQYLQRWHEFKEVLKHQNRFFLSILFLLYLMMVQLQLPVSRGYSMCFWSNWLRKYLKRQVNHIIGLEFQKFI